MQSKERWKTILEKCLEDLKNRYPRFSEGQIADKVKVPRATLNRMYNDDKKPRLENFLKVIIGSGNKQFLEEALSSYDEDIATAFKRLNLNPYKKSTIIEDRDEMAALREDKDIYLAYILCSNHKGATQEKLKRLLGTKWQHAINTLIEKGVVVDNGSSYNINEQFTPIPMPYETLKKNAAHLLPFYNPEHFGKEKNYLLIISESLSPQGLKKMQDAFARFHNELNDLIADKNNHGDLATFAFAMMDLILDESEED